MDHVAPGDWIRIDWMDGAPVAQVLSLDDEGNPVVIHPKLPGLGAMSVDVYTLAAHRHDPALFVGQHI